MRRVLAVLLAMALAVPAIAQVTEGDVSQAEERMREAQSKANTLARQLEDAYVRQVQLDDEISNLTSAIERSQVRLETAQVAVEQLAIEMYVGASSSVALVALLGGDGNTAGLEYVRRVTGMEESTIGNLKSTSLEKLLNEKPERALEFAVKGMLPRNPLGRKMYSKLRVFAGPEHTHTAQQPIPLEINV